MHYAATRGDTVLIERLINMGSTAHMVDPIYKWSPMHVAAMRGHPQVVETLMRCGSNTLNSLDAFGRTPMHYAKDAQTLEALVRCGSKVFNVMDNGGYTPVRFHGVGSALLISFLVLEGSEDRITEYHKYCKQKGELPITWTDDDALEIRFRTYFTHSLVYRLLFHTHNTHLA
jgi:hypothetical protein